MENNFLKNTVPLSSPILIFYFLFQQTNVVFVHQKYYNEPHFIHIFVFFIELNIPAFMYHLRNVFNGRHYNINKIVFISLFYQFI